MNAPPIKTCNYCKTKGVMPTFTNGETVCAACLRSFPKTVQGLHAEIVRLRTSAKAWELMAKGYGKAVDSLDAAKPAETEGPCEFTFPCSEHHDHCQASYDKMKVTNTDLQQRLDAATGEPLHYCIDGWADHYCGIPAVMATQSTTDWADVTCVGCLSKALKATQSEVDELGMECVERVNEKMDFLTERAELKAEVARLFEGCNEFRDAWDANRIRADKAESALTAANSRVEELTAEVGRLPEMDDELRWILGRPNFTLIGYANMLRKLGHEIKTRSEDEQSAVIYWMVNLYLEHGSNWRDEGKKLLEKALADDAKEGM